MLHSVVAGVGMLDHWGQYPWLLGAICLVTRGGMLSHWGRYAWSLGGGYKATNVLILGDIANYLDKMFILN